jgi:hypothetical protein
MIWSNHSLIARYNLHLSMVTEFRKLVVVRVAWVAPDLRMDVFSHGPAMLMLQRCVPLSHEDDELRSVALFRC